MPTTIGKISEEILKIISSGDIPAASNITLNEIKISVGQVCNQILKTEHFSINEKMGEKIPNGSVLALYEGIVPFTSNNKSKATLPCMPLKLPRGMGCYAIYPKYYSNGNYEYDKEFIPVQMGQMGLLNSQEPLLSDMLGQVYYERYGLELVFSKNIVALFPQVVLAMRLAIMDISLYGDWDVLPLLPEQEWQIKQEVFALYIKEGVSDLLVDPTTKGQQNVPLEKQAQTS